MGLGGASSERSPFHGVSVSHVGDTDAGPPQSSGLLWLSLIQGLDQLLVSFELEKLYFHCGAMRCLCMSMERGTINLPPVELTGQKPMQPLLGTEHYQRMVSSFIWPVIRHYSPHRLGERERSGNRYLR